RAARYIEVTHAGFSSPANALPAQSCPAGLPLVALSCTVLPCRSIQRRGTKMDGSLEFPVATPPAPGETVSIAPGVLWLRMPLPFALNHINLWLIEDGPGWTIVDCGFAGAETTGLWEQIFAGPLAGRPVRRIIVTHYHPDHIGLSGWLAEHWDAPLWITEKEWLHARMMTGEGAADYADAARIFARRAGLDAEESDIFAERHSSYRRGVPSVPPSYHRLS